MRRILPIMVIMIVLIILGMSMFKDKRDIKLISFKKNYNVTSTLENDENLYVNLLLNDDRSYFTDKNQITKCNLVDKSKDESIELLIKTITNDGRKIEYGNDDYRSYIFEFIINLNIDSFFTWYISNALLEISYNNGVTYSIKIGNFSYVKVDNDENNYFSISNIKPLTYQKDNNEYLGGIILGIRNLRDISYEINSIDILNCDTYVGDDIHIIAEIPNSNDFNEVAGYDHDLLMIGNNQVKIDIKNNDQLLLFIPIFYKQSIITNSFAIKFNIDNNEDVYLYNYTFYEPLFENIKKININIYDIK